ncbi:hypothetical protein WA158_001840 [Blastocystis sp. Blastoise]
MNFYGNFNFCVYKRVLGVMEMNKVQRKDNRKTNQIRTMSVCTGTVSTATGSCYIEIGNTKVICSVFGPRESPFSREYSDSGKLWCDVKYAPFSCSQYRSRIQDDESRNLSAQVVSTLTPCVNINSFPKSVVEIYICILESDGSSFIPCCLAASTALANAGIEMYGLLGGCTTCIKDDIILTDPTGEELEGATGQTDILYMNSTRNVVYVSHKGTMEGLLCAQSMANCIDGCNQVTTIIRNALISA